MLEPSTIAKLAATSTIELTTFGRRSGKPARIEIWWFHVEGRFIITGTPGERDWLANAAGNAAVIIHTPEGDFTARAGIVEDTEFRRRVFTHPNVSWYRTQIELDRLVATSPMIEIILDGRV